MIRCCEIFNLYLKIYYSTAEWSDDDHDFDFDYGNADEQYSHAEIIDQLSIAFEMLSPWIWTSGI